MSLSHNETRVLIDDKWRRYGRGPIATDGKLTPEQRDALVYGEYVPNSLNTGLYPGWTIADLEPVLGSSGIFSAQSNTTYVNMMFWCSVRMPRSGANGPKFFNCGFAGQDPETIGMGGPGNAYEYGADSELIRAWDLDHPQWLVQDSILNAKLWFDSSANPPGGARTGNADFKLRSSAGIRGGRGTLGRCEITGVQDGIAVFHDVTSPEDLGFFDILGNWVHGIIYYQGEGHWQPEGTHSDGIQFAKGNNIRIIGDRIQVPQNAGIQMQLEQSDRILANVDISKTIFEGKAGSGYGINHGLKQPTDFEGGSVEDNIFINTGGKDIIARQQYQWAYSGNKRAVWNDEGRTYTVTGNASIANGGA